MKFSFYAQHYLIKLAPPLYVCQSSKWASENYRLWTNCSKSFERHGLDLGLTSAPVEDLLLLPQGVEAAAAELEAAEQLTTWAAAHQSLCCLLSNSCCLRESHGERRGNVQVFFRVCPSVKVIRFQLFSIKKLLLLVLCSWVPRSLSNSHSFGLDPHNQMGTRPPPT